MLREYSHGGMIWAHNNIDILNNVEKRGATFSFTVPLVTDEMQSNDEQEVSSKNRRLSKETE